MTLRHCLVTVACLVAMGGSVPVLAEAPDAAVRKVAAGLASQHPEVVWEALPASYQRDLTGLVHDFAAAVDPAVHAKAVMVTKKAVNVLRTKRDLILSSQLAAGLAADRERAEQGWDSAVAMLDTLVASELCDLEALRALEVGTFLRTTGGQLMQQAAGASKASAEDPYASGFKTKLEDLKVEAVASEGGTATVRITPSGEPSQDLRLVRVEGRWLPEQLVSSWPRMLADAHAQVALMATPESAQQRNQVMMGLAMVDALLDQFSSMQTPEELDAAFKGLVASFARSGPAQQPPQPDP